MIGKKGQAMKHPVDIRATITLFPSDAGGRQKPTPKDWLHCILVMDDKNFDVRLDVTETNGLSPGQTACIPIHFLDSENARPHLGVGKSFLLREGHVIGNGIIEEVYMYNTRDARA
jgi:hypothetical protein